MNINNTALIIELINNIIKLINSNNSNNNLKKASDELDKSIENFKQSNKE